MPEKTAPDRPDTRPFEICGFSIPFPDRVTIDEVEALEDLSDTTKKGKDITNRELFDAYATFLGVVIDVRLGKQVTVAEIRRLDGFNIHEAKRLGNAVAAAAQKAIQSSGSSEGK